VVCRPKMKEPRCRTPADDETGAARRDAADLSRADWRNQTSLPSATNIVRLLNQAGLCKAVPADATVLLKASQADPNELKTLWDLAREFRDYVRAHPPAADYALYADYVFNPQNAEQGFVHFVVCDRKGEWVIVDMQNSHQPDYQSIGIISRERCDQLLVKRLEGYLK